MVFPVQLITKWKSFTLIQSAMLGDVPLTVGFIVCVKDPRSKVELKPRENEDIVLNGRGGSARIFNHTYYDARDVIGKVTVNSGTGLESRSFKIYLRKNQNKEERLISNFLMTKAAGHTTEGASGLDVAFCIACSSYIYGTKWEFGDESECGQKPEISLGTAGIATHHIYKIPKKDGWKGQVFVYDSKEGLQKDNPADSEEFNVIMKDLCDCTKD
ncbi:MAG: hypothetical protein HYS80_01465 [Candidatus Aenigmarchaeota archaeon]|nr:hypothetical protein [Candidatus Aenigmarchaeota archaeon]